MLNLFKYIAVTILVLATAEFALNCFDAATSLASSLKDNPAQKERESSSGSNAASDESKRASPSSAQQIKAFANKTLNVFSDPLLHFCYGATLFVLVRIARDQAHDLAIS